MNTEKIKVRVTETGQTVDVVVLSKRPERITVVLGEGVHNVKCDLTPTRNERAYAGSVMGLTVNSGGSTSSVRTATRRARRSIC